jgi:hypothetical protein
MNIDRSKYREYKLEQTRISGKIDTEFDFFVDPDDSELVEDEFISDVELSGDFHDMFLDGDVQIAYQDSDAEPTLIPNYKTLEVMLVERGLTYDNIRVQTNIDNLIYNNLYSLDDRSEEWNNIIRFESGYRPSAPFVRDPGDYIDGNDYDDQVYQKQTYLEKLRAQFEGNMIVLNDFDNDIKVESLRMMIYGEWRAVAFATRQNGRPFPETRTLEYYNWINELGLDYDAAGDWYDDESVLNIMLDEGIITNLRDDGSNSLVWNDFNHYEYNEGGRRGSDNTDYVQQARYLRYIEETNNEVFELEYMQPYEPEGSELYYEEYAPWQEIS